MRDLFLETFVSWEVNYLRDLFLERFVSWEVNYLRVLFLERIISGNISRGVYVLGGKLLESFIS